MSVIDCFDIGICTCRTRFLFYAQRIRQERLQREMLHLPSQTSRSFCVLSTVIERYCSHTISEHEALSHRSSKEGHCAATISHNDSTSAVCQHNTCASVPQLSSPTLRKASPRRFLEHSSQMHRCRLFLCRLAFLCNTRRNLWLFLLPPLPDALQSERGPPGGLVATWLEGKHFPCRSFRDPCTQQSEMS